MENMIIFDIFGWIGMVLVLVAYLLLSLGKIKNGPSYQLLNLLAATFMAIGVFTKNAWFSFVLQVVWGIIAIVAIAKIKTKKKSK